LDLPSQLFKDLIEWDKRGEIIRPRSEAWNNRQIKAGAIVPEKINGKYVMYLQREAEAWRLMKAQ